MPPNASRLAERPAGHNYISAAAVSVSGGQINGNNYLLDGGDHNDSANNVNLPFRFPDALQEFSVQTNGVSARYGLHPGPVVNVITKSGTNLHGDLFEFVRNGDFNARNFFAPTQDTLRRNQFGGTIGGPIIKDKLFLFSGFQFCLEKLMAWCENERIDYIFGLAQNPRLKKQTETRDGTSGEAIR